jgi:tripartite-type tricarboxylate transporter receptor subunit TctC
MKLPRRKFLHLAGGAAALPALAHSASALEYPTRPVHLIVGFPAGNGSDTVARLMGQWLSEQLGRQFIIDNRPGAGSNIGVETVVRAPPDGYTLLEVTVANAIGATLYDNLSFNFIRDIAPVAGITRDPNVLVVTQSFPAKTVPDFIAYAKANPGKINFASAGIGAGSHMSAELFKMMTGVNMVHVPYRGSFYADLLGGQVQVAFPPLPGAIGYIRTGKLRALAVTTAIRSEALPDSPTVGEFVPAYEASSWYGFAAPRNTPVEIIDKLNKGINAGLADPKMKGRLAALGGTAFMSSPAEFGKFLADETAKWAKVVRFAHIKPE